MDPFTQTSLINSLTALGTTSFTNLRLISTTLNVNVEGVQINYLLNALTIFKEVIGVNLDNKSLTEKNLFSAQLGTSLFESKYSTDINFLLFSLKGQKDCTLNCEIHGLS